MNLTKALFVLGRVLFGGFFLFNGLNHFLRVGQLAPYAASKGVPVPELAVILTGVLLVVGGVSLLLGFLPRIGLFAVLLFLVPVSFVMHDFWAVPDPQQRMMEMGQFIKNLALAGGALSLLAVPEPWPVSLGESKRLSPRARPERLQAR